MRNVNPEWYYGWDKEPEEQSMGEDDSPGDWDVVLDEPTDGEEGLRQP